MTRYIVFEPPAGIGEAPAKSDRAVLVRDAMAKWAVLFPFLWLFRHGLILSGLVVLAAVILLGLLADMPGLGAAAAVLPLALGVLVALEGPSLRARRLRRRGFREAAVVEADDEDEAAILYYAETAETEPTVADAIAETAGAAAPFERGRGRSLLDPQG
ncbi:MAG: DUF2628 domain-containing protein, partial [Variovorax sp.]